MLYVLHLLDWQFGTADWRHRVALHTELRRRPPRRTAGRYFVRLRRLIAGPTATVAQPEGS
jgi:hypothetical protein